jgi:hypothetical protein
MVNAPLKQLHPESYVQEDPAETGAGPGLGLGLLLHNPNAQACMGLVFGLSPQSRPQARPPGQAWPAKARACSVCKARARPKPALYRPDLVLGRSASYHSTKVSCTSSFVLAPCIYFFEPLGIHVLPSSSVCLLLSFHVCVLVKKVMCLLGILVSKELAKCVSSCSTEVRLP